MNLIPTWYILFVAYPTLAMIVEGLFSYNGAIYRVRVPSDRNHNRSSGLQGND